MHTSRRNDFVHFFVLFFYIKVFICFYMGYTLFFIDGQDFTQMVIHHVATLLLIGLSWMNNFVRIGTLVIFVHDAVDSWMEVLFVISPSVY